MYSRSKEKRNTPIYFKANCSTEMKLVPIILDYCLLQFDALKYFLAVRLHDGPLPNFDFFKANPKFFNDIAKNTSQITGTQIFTTFLPLVREL